MVPSIIKVLLTRNSAPRLHTTVKFVYIVVWNLHFLFIYLSFFYLHWQWSAKWFNWQNGKDVGGHGSGLFYGTPCHVDSKGVKPQSGSRTSKIWSMNEVLQHRWLFCALLKSACKLTTQHRVKLIHNCQHDNCSFHKPSRNLPLPSYKAILLMKQQFVIPHQYTIWQEAEKLDRPLIDKCLSMLCFFKKM